ncbi:dTDP-4-dehydrorhamnose 3,5-epimerase [Candidatus Parcubacteria bacterium]|nr:dTDP-4-dehydrorhamnose 3,5-epimerase [Candidatus Parcubacteria bacterium]
MHDASVKIQKLGLSGVCLVSPERFEDQRGYFVEVYNAQIFERIGISPTFVQDAVSHSRKGVLRGLHYQKSPHGQAKLVRCTYGEVFDVAADIDPASPTYGQYISTRLSGDTQAMLYLPAGYAHGFCVLSDMAVVEYKLEAVHAESAEGVRYDDPLFNIAWPISDPVLSANDMHWPLLPQVPNTP